jgi:glucose-6-phosphate isomerase
MQVEPGVTTGDYLSGFYLGTRQALYEKGRESVSIIVKDASPYAIGALFALFERAVGLYASLIKINAYHQPGVQAGKLAAGDVIAIKLRVMDYLYQNPAQGLTVAQIAQGIGAVEDQETIFKLCEHLSANPDNGVIKSPGQTSFEAIYHKT